MTHCRGVSGGRVDAGRVVTVSSFEGLRIRRTDLRTYGLTDLRAYGLTGLRLATCGRNRKWALKCGNRSSIEVPRQRCAARSGAPGRESDENHQKTGDDCHWHHWKESE